MPGRGPSKRRRTTIRHLRIYRYVDTVARVGSIRGAAESLAITASALNRRILALEDDLGVAIFERLPQGVRPTTAGELLLQHIRTQFSDLDRLHSQIADLSGIRRGRVVIASSQAPLSYLLPEQVALYRHAHPGVNFELQLRDRTCASAALIDHSADLAVVFEPAPSADFHPLMSVPQRIHAVMSATHPLATGQTLRLRDCLTFPLAVPSDPHGVRLLLETALALTSRRLEPAVESDSFEFLRHSLRDGELITFQIPVGLADDVSMDGVAGGVAPSACSSDLTARPLAERDVPPGLLSLGQLRGRTLPVAAARFAQRLSLVLEERYG